MTSRGRGSDFREGFEYFDITPTVSERTGVFPGDTRYKRSVQLSFAQGHHLELSRIETSVHIGAHADAPSHYDAKGIGIGERDLLPYLGRAQVVSASVARGGCVGIGALASSEFLAPRVLIRTGTFPDPDAWNSDFAALEPALIDHLAAAGIQLVGLDTPSIDPENSQTLSAHARVRVHGMAILEGLVLDRVPDGLYALIALPLKLEGADAAPVRAVLVRDPSVLLAPF